MENRYAIILAAGKGSRMKSSLYKVLHPVAGKPMVEHVIEQVEAINVDEIVTIVGFGAEMVKDHLGERSKYALQTEQLGTGHAVLATADLLKDKKGTTLVICGDTPLLTSDTLDKLVKHHEETNAKATILSAIARDASGYGRIVRNDNNLVEKIVEHKDASEAELLINEFNTGTYCFDNEFLFEALTKVGNDNAQGEYYLPDVISILKEQGEIVTAFVMDSEDESMGVNDRVALAKASQLMNARINEAHMKNGVTFVDPSNTYIESDVVIGHNTLIEPGVVLRGKTVIGDNCYISANSDIKDSVLGNHVKVHSSNIKESTIRDGADVGPYAHIRPNSDIHENAHIGNFVEIKKATIGKESKVGHLTYVGDATLGKDINVGCGTVFVNYDGKNKFHTTIGDHSFIGSGTNLVGPVTLGRNSATAAGSTITEDVPEDALGIARGRQSNLEGYAKKMPYNE
ncbi:bifunctional UDP-N-acetylglucosamine diphosphorylase/glucosamine-1-phosphate N-acetyltransferase GlmU [Vagococcus carniphilus]|uniref:bifunctional UDP-N-acetylglucosamine diphosphorylase/glucosamine-1-phosphate N-acetyltransferase GlmU n=1 Tax=Vagococcus carniphilus TaxID=218144 RepID=UPI00288E555F|nr:bifunctional UDP-N-acetylglucosamine diphosphorylase/glucosamine-1-phosphate N-acetyltransferase GlmU [Vagococcus carniphilus]MDT2831757.1 bifunctional UDP-N-acetylglucosamine diphosphorylase/glucosamine-1-phosphate N-acetyltransferase GlmU [Vagococcus carniphilus]MDT2840610.1 bifunctional UDP-N-acetylglucosamine diphosphorylase/glucosamine-1-phosphate N-acetyltransferase GlmU [Vagococcus carniphilus]MDT2855268.1 bifunctional UDP-N-acetylglucosamine diphosphorylase/glucosamine-1-phosphate N-a